MSRSRGGVHVEVADARSADDSPDVHIDLDRWRSLAVAALETEGAVGVLGLTFVDADEIAELNSEHLGKDGPTDVLSFPIDGPDLDVEAVHADQEIPALLGDVVISPAVAAAQFPTHAGALDDELALLVVHGVLHVLGHDHAEPDETERMRERELRLLEEHHWGHDAPAGFRQDHAEP